MSDIAITYTIVAAVIVLFVWDRFPVVIVALATTLALFLTGILSVAQSFAGFGDPTVIFIASLFVVSAGLEATGVTAWAGKVLIKLAGTSRARLIVLIMLAVAILAALININGSVPALLPVVVVMAVRLGYSTSQLLMPLAFAASAGSLLALTGTPVNVIASNTAADAGVGGFGYFEFAMVGVPALVGTILIVVLIGRKLLPERGGEALSADLSKHARTLVEHYRLENGVFRLRVRDGSPFVGARPAEIELSGYPDLSLVQTLDGSTGKPLSRANLADGDYLILRGDADSAGKLAAEKSLAFRDDAHDGDVADSLLNRESGLAEVVIPPRSPLIGKEFFPGMVTDSGDLMVLAIQRGGQDLAPVKTALAAGDTLLLQGTWKALDKHLDDPDVLVVHSPELVRRQAVPMGPGSARAVVILVAVVLMLALGLVPPVVAGVLGACAMIVLRVLSVDQAYRAINWTTVILIGAMTPLSTAMAQTGAATRLADMLVGIVGDAGPYALLAGLFVLTAVLGQLISNTATALIVFPIAVVAAAELGLSPRPVIMSVNVAAAASFLTPVATPVNLIVMGPGGYRFSDYWKLGLPIMIWFFVVSVFLVPMIWSF